MKINGLMLLPLFMLVISSCKGLNTGTEPEDHQEDVIANNSFESTAAASWNNLRTGNYEYYAPVDGKYYAVVEYGDDTPFQETGITIEAGKTYTLTLWARSIYDDAHTEALMGPEENYPSGNRARATANVQLLADGNMLGETWADVSPVALKGAPAEFTNDDGGNVWIDGGYRHAFSESRFVQPLSADPIHDPWELAPDFDAYEIAQEDHGAHAPIIIGDRKLLYLSSFSDSNGEDNDQYRDIQFIEVEGDGNPGYRWPDSPPGQNENVVISHAGNEDIVAFDQHLFYDEQEERLWMAWGGNKIFVTELSPSTGLLLSPQVSTEFDTHPQGLHHFVADRDENGDKWTGDNEWIEGPTLYKHNGYWYLFASYGSLMNNYTIRMGRSQSPIGPFQDKDGVELTRYDPQKDRYGSSFFLGDDGEHLVPGHAHIWEESGRFYVGYDYRKKKALEGEEEPGDIFGIREMYWVNGWPTIWIPITVSFNADDHPESIGKKLGIAFGNAGEEGSVAAFDLVNIEISQ